MFNSLTKFHMKHLLDVLYQICFSDYSLSNLALFVIHDFEQTSVADALLVQLKVKGITLRSYVFTPLRGPML